MHVLVVVRGTGVFRPGLSTVDLDVRLAEQRFGEVEEAGAYRQQAELRAGEWELVDPGELVAEEPLAARVSAIVEAVGGREHQAQLVHRRFQVLDRYKARKDHEAVFAPGLCRVCEIHRPTIAGADRHGQPIFPFHIAW